LISFIQVRNVGQTNENISGSGGEDRKNEREKSNLVPRFSCDFI
jgi:hypothetical protein